jgi:hypothetical protein
VEEGRVVEDLSETLVVGEAKVEKVFLPHVGLQTYNFL